MAIDQGNGSLSTALVNILTSIHQAMGRVEARVEANAEGTNRRIDDLKKEVFHRFIRVEAQMQHQGEQVRRIETGKTVTPMASDWVIALPWRLILKCMGYLLVGGLMALAHTKVPELKQILGLMMQQQP